MQKKLKFSKMPVTKNKLYLKQFLIKLLKNKISKSFHKYYNFQSQWSGANCKKKNCSSFEQNPNKRKDDTD